MRLLCIINYINHFFAKKIKHIKNLADTNNWKFLFGKDFIRDRLASYPNNFLNYGYAVLRTFVTRAIMDAGLLPMVGIFHKNYFDDFPLTDDLMEPFRPYIDNIIYEMVRKGQKELNKDIKKELVEIFYTNINYEEIYKSIHSFASVCIGESQFVYFPMLK